MSRKLTPLKRFNQALLIALKNEKQFITTEVSTKQGISVLCVVPRTSIYEYLTRFDITERFNVYDLLSNIDFMFYTKFILPRDTRRIKDVWPANLNLSDCSNPRSFVAHTLPILMNTAENQFKIRHLQVEAEYRQVDLFDQLPAQI